MLACSLPCWIISHSGITEELLFGCCGIGDCTADLLLAVIKENSTAHLRELGAGHVSAPVMLFTDGVEFHNALEW